MLAPLFNQVIDKIDLKQFALPGRSTTHAPVYLLHCILEALDNSHSYARILFTDFGTGFDLVDHSVLVSEPRDLGVHEALIRWIGAFLTGRSQQVKIGSALSNSVIPRGGIPQGTRLQFWTKMLRKMHVVCLIIEYFPLKPGSLKILPLPPKKQC